MNRGIQYPKKFIMMIQYKQARLQYLPLLVFLDQGNSTGMPVVLLLAIIMVFIAGVLLSLKFYNNQRKNSAKLNQTIVELDNVSRALAESISYAERIQGAILPAPEKMEDTIPDHLILFRPKEKVSGDFYWTERRGGKRMFAVVDCSGHGIPGGLMSLIAYDGLNRALNEYEITRADKIVSTLNEFLTETLKQTGSIDIKDVIDLALCVYNPEKSVIEYTGAKNPLYIVREKKNTLFVNDIEIKSSMSSGKWNLFVVKPDRKSLEPRDDLANYTNNHIKVEDGDRIYLFSDGYADQFGGGDEKKFGYKRLRQTILSVQDHPMKEQKRRLERVFNEWKNKYEQVDDVTILGVKI